MFIFSSQILNSNIMAKAKHKGPGAEFNDLQKSVDKAMNENKKATTGKQKLDPDRQNQTEYKPDVDVKKAGRSKR
jgi:hypothetical protein